MTAESSDPFETLAAELAQAETESLPDEAEPEAVTPLDELDPADVPVEVRAALESILLVAEEPVAPTLLAQLLEVPVTVVASLCEHLAEEFAAQERGFTISRVAGGYRFQSAAAQSPYVERFLLEGQSARLSAAALETLAIVAYKQPISRAQVASIRGVNVDGVVRTLQQRGYINEIGRDAGPGNAVLYGTTRSFLERLGLDHLGELPSLGDFVPDADVVETLELALRVTDDEEPPAVAADADVAPSTSAEA
jgi:segregation and condensation protein B